MELLQQLLELTQMQEKALANEAIDDFEKLMEQREVCIKAIEESGILKEISQDAQVYDIIKEVKLLDDQNLISFNKQLEEVKSKLKQIRLTQKSGASYNNPYDISYEEGVFFEKKN